jgi:hypothetical protein
MAVFRHLRPIGASAGFRLGSLHRRDNIFAFHDVDIDNSQARRPAASCKASRCHCGVRVASARASVASATDNQRKLQGARANRSRGGDKLIASARWNRRTIAGPDVLPGTSRRPPRFAWWRRMYGIRSGRKAWAAPERSSPDPAMLLCPCTGCRSRRQLRQIYRAWPSN